MAKPSMAQNPRSRPLPSNSGVLSEKPNRANIQPTSNPSPSNSASKKPARKKKCLRKAGIEEQENISDVFNAPGEVDQRPDPESDEAQDLLDTDLEQVELLTPVGKPKKCMTMANDQKRQPLISNFGVLTPNPNMLNIQQPLSNPTPEPSNTTPNEPTRKRKRLHRGRRRNALPEQEMSTELGDMEETLDLSGVEISQKTEEDNLPLPGVKETQEGEDHLSHEDEDHLSHEDEDHLLREDEAYLSHEDEAYLLLYEDEEYTSDLEEASEDAKDSSWPASLEFDAELLKSARVKIIEAGPRHDSRLAGLVMCCLRIFQEEASSPISQQHDIMTKSFHHLVKRHTVQEFMEMFMWGIQESVISLFERSPDVWTAEGFLDGKFHRAADTGAQGVYFDVVMSENSRQLIGVYVGSSGGMMRRIKTHKQIVERLKVGKAEENQSSLYYAKLQEPVKSHHFVFAKFSPPLPNGCVHLLEAIATVLLGSLQQWGSHTSCKLNSLQVSALIERVRFETCLAYHPWEPLNAAFQLMQGFTYTIPVEARICSNKNCKAHGDAVVVWVRPRSEWGAFFPGPLICGACYAYAAKYHGVARNAALVERTRLRAIPHKDRDCSNPNCMAHGEEVKMWRHVKEEWKEFFPGPFLCQACGMWADLHETHEIVRPLALCEIMPGDDTPVEDRVCSNKNCRRHGKTIWGTTKRPWLKDLPGPWLCYPCHKWALHHGGEARSAAMCEALRMLREKIPEMARLIPVKERECSNPNCSVNGTNTHHWQPTNPDWVEEFPGPWICQTCYTFASNNDGAARSALLILQLSIVPKDRVCGNPKCHAPHRQGIIWVGRKPQWEHFTHPWVCRGCYKFADDTDGGFRETADCQPKPRTTPCKKRECSNPNCGARGKDVCKWHTPEPDWVDIPGPWVCNLCNSFAGSNHGAARSAALCRLVNLALSIPLQDRSCGNPYCKTPVNEVKAKKDYICIHVGWEGFSGPWLCVGCHYFAVDTHGAVKDAPA